MEKRRKFRPFLLGLLCVVVAASAAIGLVAVTKARSSSDKRAARPAAFRDVRPQGTRQGRHSEASFGATEERGPDSSPAAEAYANRAYPADEIPFQLSLNAQAAFATVKARGVGKGKKTPGQWTLVGPSTARYPGFLTYSGQEYVTSGRITALAIAPVCTSNDCRLWLGAAGGGIWRTSKALSGNPIWTFVSSGLPSNAIGSLLLDPSDPTGNTIYAGTGEANASGDSEAGVGLFKSTDGGDNWSAVGTSADFSFGRSIGSLAIDPTDPNIIYMATTRGVRGISSVSGGGTSNPPVAAPFGLYKTTDGGATWSFIWNGNASIRGVRRVEVDPLDHTRVYASAYQQGIWRSTGGGAFEQVFAPTAPAFNTDRTEFALTVKNGHTRIYAGDGAQGAPPASFWRVDNADVAAATLTAGGANIGWTSLTSSDPTNPHYGTYDFCTGQCWYDSYVVTPAGYPDVVYLGGSYQYGEYGRRSNGRGIVLSRDAGETFTDQTWDANSSTPMGLHPDHHHLVTNPADPLQFFSASDGGIVRSTGTLVDNSGECARRPLGTGSMAACRALLSAVPSNLVSLNTGLSTLQFQSLSVNPANAKHLMGGTQDNGTFETNGSFVLWPQIINGDGGQSGFHASDPSIRMHTYYYASPDVSFKGGQPQSWNWIGDPIYLTENQSFYVPIITDPRVGGTMFVGSSHVWRTLDNGGPRDYLELHCNEFTGDFSVQCGDWEPLGDPTAAGQLGSGAYGATRAGGYVAAVERTLADDGTLWAATQTGRVFISKNANDPDPAAVTFTRLDSLAANSPGRFVSGIYVDPANANHAWISYSGYNFNTPAQPGHVFEVTFDPGAGTAIWTNLDGGTGPMGDLPVTDIARDDVSGDLYASTDFGVMRLPNGTSAWLLAGTGLPAVEVAGLTVVPSARKLYAATHGRSAWMLTLP